MENIFEGAKFGDKFLTRECSKAVFIKEEKQGNKTWYKCIIIDIHNDEYVEYYHQDGRINYSSGEEDLDIVSRYKEPIDEEKLDELAEKYCDSTLPFTQNSKEYWVSKEDFKAGYHKAMEE